MNLSDEKTIAFNWKKIVFYLMLAIILVLAGLRMLLATSPWECDSHRLWCVIEQVPLLRQSLGFTCVLFFSWGVLVALQKLSDHKPGIELSSDGIIDNSSGMSTGFIPWTDIETIQSYRFGSSQFVLVKVRNPEKYINQGNLFRCLWARLNHLLSGTPIFLTSGFLEISFNQLLELCQSYLLKYGKQ